MSGQNSPPSRDVPAEGGEVDAEGRIDGANEQPWIFTSKCWISSWALRSVDIPDPEGPLDTTGTPDLGGVLPPIWRFALTFQGFRWLPYEDLYVFWRLSQEKFNRQKNVSFLQDSLDALRGLLFFTQRYPWRKGSQHDGLWERRFRREAEFSRALVRKISRTIYEAEWWEERESNETDRRLRRTSRSNESMPEKNLYELAATILSEAEQQAASASVDVQHQPHALINAVAPPSDDPFVVYHFTAAKHVASALVLEAADDESPLSAASRRAYELAGWYGPE